MTDDPTLALLSFAGWTSFLKSLASFSGDLSGLTAPPFVSLNASATIDTSGSRCTFNPQILSPTSLSEFPCERRIPAWKALNRTPS